MTDHEPPETPGADDLQFDRAEYAGPAPTAPTCAACKQPIAGSYYEVNGNILCDACRGAILERYTGGSGFVRFVRACLFGAMAGLVGFLIYFGVLKLTGYEVGLISILVGLLVGGAVRAGSRHRGGWLYQALAVAMTYLAIGASYTAQAIPMMQARQQQAAGPAAPAPKGPAKPAPAPPGPGGANAPAQSAPLPVLIFVAIVFCVILPVVVNLQNPIGLLIVGFALWEAWKINRRAKFVITGPYQVAPGASPAAPEGMPGPAGPLAADPS
jgi:hypothetical protein